MAVGAALEPDYHIKFRDAMRRYTARLQKTHDISKDGIVDMRRPTSDEILNGFWMLDWYHLFGQGFGDVRLTYQPYGVIHTYSGYRSVSFYPQLRFFNAHLGTGLNPAEARQVVEVNVKLNFVLRRERVKAYVAIGLQALHNAINDLRRLTADAPMPSLFEVDPSFRETYNLLGELAPVTPTGTPDFSGFRMLSTLAGLGGLPVQRPLSWRDSLNAVLASATDPTTARNLGLGP